MSARARLLGSHECAPHISSAFACQHERMCSSHECAQSHARTPHDASCPISFLLVAIFAFKLGLNLAVTAARHVFILGCRKVIDVQNNSSADEAQTGRERPRSSSRSSLRSTLVPNWVDTIRWLKSLIGGARGGLIVRRFEGAGWFKLSCREISRVLAHSLDRRAQIFGQILWPTHQCSWTQDRSKWWTHWGQVNRETCPYDHDNDHVLSTFRWSTAEACPARTALEAQSHGHWCR